MALTNVKTVVRYGLQMRENFNFSSNKFVNWFPGHMSKGMAVLQKQLKNVDCVIEIHDARIPLSGRNPMFQKKLYGVKPHLFIFNKIDLVDFSKYIKIRKYYQEKYDVETVLFTNCKNPNSKGVKMIVPTVVNLIKNSNRFNRAEERDYNLMIIGIPNVGKSSLINALRSKHLRRRRATAVGAIPGITRSVLEKIKVCSNPNIYLLDSPGILPPQIPNVETGLKLALAHTIMDDLMDSVVLADFLLFSDKKTVPDLNRSADILLRAFRKGDLGPFILDDIDL